MRSKDCAVCTRIQKFFRNPHQFPREGEQLGIFGQLAYDPACARHPKLLRELFDPTVVGVIDELQPVTLFCRGYYPASFAALRLGNGPIATTRWLSVAPNQQNISLSLAVTRHTSSEWMDMELIKSHMTICDASHQCCSNETLSPGLNHRPQWVVDVHEFCIIPCTKDSNYLALSYIRGNVASLLATKENLEALQVPGALQAVPFCTLLPQTIQDAMLLVKSLGMRYLWVDTLCIIQDDEMRHSELARMASIYSNAEVTIIVANGTSCDIGIPGISGVSKPLSRERPIYTIGQTLRLHSFHCLGNHPDHLAAGLQQWDNRAWTFQESAFSRRQIIFYDQYVAWQCSKGCRYEQVCWPRSFEFSDFEPYPHELRRQVSNIRVLPSMTHIATAIEAFNTRDLTYPEDILDAFQSIATFFGQHCEGGFVSGIPAMFFNLGLLWQSENVERRIPKSSEGNRHLPSWSWAGWKGMTRSWSYRHLSSDFCLTDTGEEARPPFFDKVTSSLHWKGHLKPQGEGVDIRSTWSRSREDYMNDLNRSVPPGWTRHITAEVIDLLDYCSGERGFVYVGPEDLNETLSELFEPCHYDDCQEHWTREAMPRCFYTHESVPGNAYLFPLTVPTPDTPSVSTIIPLISCQTSTAFLYAGTQLPNSHEYPAVSVHDEDGRWVGALNVQKNPDEIVFGEQLELIELAQGRNAVGRRDSEKVFFEWEHPECPQNDALYEYYYVMWIERKESICYRQGIGRILKHAWDKISKKQTQVMLG